MKKHFYRWVVDHPKLILAAFSAAFIGCLLCRNWIAVNYDINDYLPAESPSTIALDVMGQEYEGGIPNARVMIKDVSIPEALEYKQRLESVEGVLGVTWLDDVATVTQPLDFIDQDSLDTYYKDGDALFSVTIAEGEEITACDALRAIIGEDNYLAGNAVSTAQATTSTVNEIPVIAVVGVSFAALVLLVTTTSWAEPFIVLAGLGVAVVINAGSNLIFGEISFVSNAAGSILQLAVSLDYSVFLIHRFEECRETETDPKAAMVEALCGSTTSIMSSGLTTVIGFLALCLMRFEIGPDLGLVLAKGVALSMITVFVFMPVFVLATYPLIDKTHHRSLIPSFAGMGRAVCRIMVPCVVIFFVVMVPCYLASNQNSFYYGASHIFGEETKLGADTAAIEQAFGQSDTYVLMVPKSSTATQKQLSNALRALPEVKSILSYVDTVGTEIPEQYLDEATLSQLNSENYTRMVLTVDAAYEGDETFALVEEIRSIAEEYYPGEWLLAGQGVSTLDLRDTVVSDMVGVNLIAIAAVFVVLLFSLRSLLLPVILVLGIETAIWINLAIPYFTDQPLFYIAYLIISSIQLGATVDYAILFTDRYLEYRQSMGRRTAIRQVITTCTASVLTSGSVLTVVGYLMGFVSTHGLLAQLGRLLGQGTICSVVIVLFVLPGMLFLFDKPIQKLTRNANFAPSGASQQPTEVEKETVS